MSVKCSKNLDSKIKKQYIPHKLRSRPFRCISLPIFCLVLFICYWFVMTPLIYVYLGDRYRQLYKNKWPSVWPYYFWLTALIVFVILLSVLICLWCCTPKRETSEQVEHRQKEYDSLLNEVIEYSTLKCNSLKHEKIKLKDSSENINANFNDSKENSDALRDVDCVTISKETLDDKSTEEKSVIPLEIIIPKDSTQNDGSGESMLKEIDKMFPRCSVRRKTDRKRPDTLILHSPHPAPKTKEADVRRHTTSDPVSSPLTPREIFFYDFIQNANKQLMTATHNFIENERKHSSNNFVNLRKPEVKDFVLKERSNTEASSPEYFIANVSSRRSCTAEAFLFVDGGPAENELKICYIADDDDVFKN